MLAVVLRYISAGVAAAAVLLPAAAGAIVIRDDVADAVHLNLGVAEENVGKLLARRRLDCTATLIAPGWALTAAHCLTDMSRVRLEFEGQNVAARSWYVHKRWNNNERRGYDIGLIRLRTPVVGVTPATLYRGSDEVGQVGRIVGYGDHGDGQIGANDFDAQRRTAYNDIDAVAFAAGRPSVLVTDFDAPGDPGVLANEGTTAPGDSGGPLFIGTAIAGITSWGSSDYSTYGDLARYTRVSSFANWVDSILRRPGRAARRAYVGGPNRRISDLPSFRATAFEWGPLATYSHANSTLALDGPRAAVPEPTGLAVVMIGALLVTPRRARPA